MIPTIGALQPWTDPETIAIGRLPMRVPGVAWHDIETARGGDRASSPWWRSLDGEWNFCLYADPDAVPANAVDGTETPQHTLTVPGNWTVQDTGDHPHYTNVQMPFDGPPPRLPDANPTGVYWRHVDVDPAWTPDRSTVLHIGGADSVHAVYVNGFFVGYGTDSRLASEYDVTTVVRPGDNVVAVVVVRYSSHSYIEDQDQWWMAGLHREVFLESRAGTHLGNVRCDADLDLGERIGTVRVTCTVAGSDRLGRGWTVRTSVETMGGRRIGAPITTRVPYAFERPYRFTGHRAVADHRVPRVAAWSAEQPNRYRVLAELIDPDGAVVEVRAQSIGFRCVEIRDRQLLVNGQPTWIFGVNRHDHDPTRGKAVAVEDMRADLVAMKRHNVNAMRTSHYPNDPRLLDLCDELGIFVVDEANIESHAYNTSLCDDSRYRAAWLARGSRMVERDRNHPCIIMWSLGNESGYGANHDALAGWIRRSDPTRPLHYEGAVFHDGWVDGGRAASDVVCPMYAPIDAIAAYGSEGVGDRPLILCEYSHAMGNSNGSLADYWAVITTTPGLQGGFLWEWKDHGLLQRQADGSQRLAYGGMYGDTPNDGNFVADGLMSADLVPHPAMREVAWVHRPVTVQSAPGRRLALVVSNRQSSNDLSELRATWRLDLDGAVVASGRLTTGTIAPHSSVTLPLPCALPGAPGELRLTVQFVTRRATEWADAGHVVAWDQLLLRAAPTRRRSTVPAGRPRTRSSPSSREVVVDLTSVEQLLAQPVTLDLWRAATDNDGFKLMPEMSRRFGVGGQALNRWQDAAVDTKTAGALVHHEMRRVVVDDDTVEHHHLVDVPAELHDLPRIGVSFQLPSDFDRLRWFGRGPHENYPDRNASAMVAIWETGIDASPYLVPQEFGLRTDCRWFEAIGRDGRTVRVDVLHPSVLHCSAVHHTDADLFAAAHHDDLRPRPELVVRLDVAHRGLGTASCGPDVLDRYIVPAGIHSFGYRLSLRHSSLVPERRSGVASAAAQATRSAR